MCEPTAQAYDGTVRTDDSGIDNNDRLLRHCRVPVQIVPLKRDGVVIGRKISDQAFKAKKGEVGISIDIECLVLRAGKTWQDRYGLMPNTCAMIAVRAFEARKHGRGVAWTPKPAEAHLVGYSALENPYHGEIILPLKSNSAHRELFRSSEIVHETLDT